MLSTNRAIYLEYVYCPVGSRISGRLGVRVFNTRFRAQKWTDGGGACVACLAWAGRQMVVDARGLGGWEWTGVGTPGSDGGSRFAQLGAARNHSSWERQYCHFL